MATEYKRILLRRGDYHEMDGITPEIGEPIYLTDYKRIVVGDGSEGGTSVASKFLGFANISNIEASGITGGLTNDLVYDLTSNLLYVLSGSQGAEPYKEVSNYVPITNTPSPDNLTVYNNSLNKLSLRPGGINGTYLASSALGNGLEKRPGNESIIDVKINVDSQTILDFNDGLLINDNSIENNKLANMPSLTVKGNLDTGSNTPQDITLADLASEIQTSLNFNSVVPVGSIIEFPGNNLPSNYFVCDGRSLSVSEYPDLFAVLGTAFGSQASGFFNIPNLTSNALNIYKLIKVKP